MVDYILAGLDREYDPIVAVKNSIIVDDICAEIAAFDQRLEMLGDGRNGGSHSSANAAYRGRGKNRGRGRGRSRGRGRGSQTPPPSHGNGGEGTTGVPHNNNNNSLET